MDSGSPLLLWHVACAHPFLARVWLPMLATEWLRKVAQGRHYPPVPGLQSPRDNQEGLPSGVSWDRVGIARLGKESGEGWPCHSALRSQQNRHLRFSFGSFPRDLGKSALPGVGDEGERGSAFCLRCYTTRGMVQASSPLERQTSWFRVVGEGSGSNSVEPQSVSSPTQERVHPSVSFAEWAGPRPSNLRARGLGTLSWVSISGGYSLDTQAGGRPRVPCISQGVRGSL